LLRVPLSRLCPGEADWALGEPVVNGRFTEADSRRSYANAPNPPGLDELVPTTRRALASLFHQAA